jgi:serine phosphatase RsbU (regulator of sigma subunit)
MWKNNLDKLSRHIAIIVVLASAAIMGYIMYELSITKQKVATTLVNKSLSLSHDALKEFFNPIKKQLHVTRKQFEMRQLVAIDTLEVLKSFIPVLMSNEQLKSMAVANEKGRELDILRDDSPYYWKMRLVDPTISKSTEFWSLYRIDEEYKIKKDSSWIEMTEAEAINRPWFDGALKSIDDQTLHWTAPYFFSTTNKVGITVSTGWSGESVDSWKLTAFDLSTEYLDNYTQSIKPTPNGQIAIVTGDHQHVVGFPPYAPLDEVRKERILTLADIPHAEIKEVLRLGRQTEPVNFTLNGEEWWGASRYFYLSADQSYEVVIALPESDFLAEVNESQKFMFFGFFGILLLSVIILRGYHVQRKNSELLFVKNTEILKQNDIIAHKNEEILDSINYAKRIQNAILPSEQRLAKELPSSFIFYEPKDIVSGDFYWLEKQGDLVMFAAADCTGHGVPGAMVSVMCHNALNRSIKEYGLIAANEILDKTREIVVGEFEKSDVSLSDGMDISLVILNTTEKTISWAGANNPLWIIRKSNPKNIEEFKADKQPIGNYLEMKPFTEHVLSYEQGDLIYIFSDGYQDQFGGPRGKKLKPSAMRKLFIDIQSLPMKEQKERIKQYFYDWRGQLENVDDVCVIGVRLE